MGFCPGPERGVTVRRNRGCGTFGEAPHMKRFGGRLAAALVLALLPATAGTALATYDGAWATVEVRHGADVVATYQGTGSCSGLSCTVSVSMVNRDSGRFSRWCGGSG